MASCFPLLRGLTSALLSALLASLPVSSIRGQARAAQPPAVTQVDPLHQTGGNVTISLLTVGNGDELWAMFGHSAILIRDTITGRDTVFNWGEFDMRKPNFILHFLQGLNFYQMGGSPLDTVLLASRHSNRSVVSQQLALTTPQKDSLLHLIRINAQPENITYRYDYFQNNCATRPRDLLDAVLGGAIRAHSSELTNTSYRWHAERLMQSNTPLVMGVHIGLGEPSDAPITRWQTMFLPKQLHDMVNTLQVRDSGGRERPLVANETVLYRSTRGAEPDAPPNLAPMMLVIGLMVAALFAWFGSRAERATRATRITAALLFGLWSLVAGLLGVVLSLLWGVTDHIFAHANENLLLFNPLWLVLAVLLPIWWLSDTGRAARATRAIAYVLAGLSVVALIAHAVFISRQVNLAVIGLALPPALAIAWSLARASDRAIGSHAWVTRARYDALEYAGTGRAIARDAEPGRS